MKVDKCKWKNGADSAVMFMIDDLANIWHDENLNGVCDIGEDWGHQAYEKNSMWNFLCKNFLDKFPHLKVTFFLVVGKRASIINNKKYTYCDDILVDEKFLAFLRDLDKNPKVEIAYHGLTHGIGGNKTEDFVQEWQTYKNLDEAIETIKQGREIFYKALGHYPRGGKYPGYAYNSFSDESIVKTGFDWWCRHLDVLLEDKRGDYENYSYEIERFDGVIDIPSTIDGAYYSLKAMQYLFTRKYVKSFLYRIVKGRTVEKLIDERVKNNQIISIQEHTSPVRTDGRIQFPNIVTDKNNLYHIFKYLERYNLWYATGSEIADYYNVYEKTEIKKLSNGKYQIKTDEKNIGKEISIKISGNKNNKIKIGEKILSPVANNIGEIFNIELYETNFEIQLL